MLTNKNPYYYLKCHGLKAVMIFSSVILINGCNEETPVENTLPVSRIAGKIYESADSDGLSKNYVSISGASVSLMKLSSTGTLEKITASEVISDAEGKFVIETSFSGSSDLVIVAEKDGRIWKAILTSEVKAGLTVYSQPLTLESSIEAEIYIQAKKLRYNNVQYADISIFINSEIAAQLVNDSYSRDLLLQALEQAAYVHAMVVTKGELGGDENKWKAAISLFSEAQATLERDLYFSDTDSESETAVKKYINSRVFACKNAGLNAALYYNTISITLKVLLNVTVYCESGLRLLINKRSAFIKALLLRHAVEENFAELGSSRSIVNAGDVLQEKIKTAVSEEEINKSFDEYNIAVVNQLKSAPGSNALIIANAIKAIEEISGKFWSTIKPGILPDEIAISYILYYQQVYSVLSGIIQFTGESKKERVLSIIFFTGSNYRI